MDMRRVLLLEGSLGVKGGELAGLGGVPVCGMGDSGVVEADLSPLGGSWCWSGNGGGLW